MPGSGACRALAPPRAEDTQPEKAAATSRELEVRGAVSGPAPSSAPAAVRGAPELAEARRRLLEAEGRRRLVSELESRVQQLHRVFLEAELRMATRAESLGRLGSGVAQAELHLSAPGQRPKRTLLRRYKKARPPALLAAALGLGSCVPWPAGRGRRGGGPEPPESPFRRSIQGAAAAAAAPEKKSKTAPEAEASWASARERRKGGGAASRAPPDVLRRGTGRGAPS